MSRGARINVASQSAQGKDAPAGSVNVHIQAEAECSHTARTALARLHRPSALPPAPALSCLPPRPQPGYS